MAQSQRLNICLISQGFPVLGRIGGPAHLRPIAAGLAMRGHQVTVLTGHDPFGRRSMQLEGANVHFLLEGKSSRVRKDFFMNLVKSKFLDLHSAKPFDIIHSFDSGALKISRFRRNHRVAVAYEASATHMEELFSILGFEQETFSSVARTLIAVS